MLRSLQRCVLAGFIGGFCLVLAESAPAAIGYDWVLVEGDPLAANAPDGVGGFGSGAGNYKIGATEVTNAQYAEFLDAVAKTDTNGLYSAEMNSNDAGGITQSGSSGTFTYSTKAGFETKPVNFVSFYDALRFANWHSNANPTGAQDSTTTEDGAYTITAAGITANSITRNSLFEFFIPNEDEWYKAAYFDPGKAGGPGYWDYPAGSDTVTGCFAPTPTANRANCFQPVGGGTVTDVASYTGSASPAGTFDQGGNVWEWHENTDGPNRGLRGGSFTGSAFTLAAVNQTGTLPGSESSNVGFRLGAIPEPGTGLLVMVGILGLGAARGREA